MPTRKEVDSLFSVLSGIISEYKICGWYRRGLQTGDVVDCAVANLAFTKKFDGLRSIDAEYVGRPSTASGESYIINRIPCNFYPYIKEEYGALVLRLTGNFLFTRMIRAWAKRQGMLLNNQGLYRGGEILAGISERQIFYMLDLKYLPPNERNFTAGASLPDADISTSIPRNFLEIE